MVSKRHLIITIVSGEKEQDVTYQVTDLVNMARALSEGELDTQFQHHFQGELGELASYLEAIRQTLQSIAVTADTSNGIIPAAADGMEKIRHESEAGFNSVWEVVETLQEEQAATRTILSEADGNLSAAKVIELRSIVSQSQQTLLSLMSYLSFQDVLRQRIEKIHGLIETLEKKTVDLMVTFNVNTSKNASKEGDSQTAVEAVNLDQELVDKLLQDLK